MVDVWSELEEGLKQKAETPAEILGVKKYKDDRICQIHCIGKCPGEPCGYFKEKWVRLEDVKEAIQQLKQNYIVIEKKKFKDEIVFGGLSKNRIINDLHQTLEELIKDFVSFKASFIETKHLDIGK